MIRVFFCLISLGQCFTSSLAQDEPSLEIDSPTNCMAGQDVTFTVRTSDKAARRYKFVAVYKDVGSEHTVLIRDFAAASACTWRPTLPEEYKVIVSARELGATTENGERQATKMFQVTSTFSLDLNVCYGTAKGPGGRDEALLLDVYGPPSYSTNKRPVMVLAHGGGFGGGDKSQGFYVRMAEAYASAGYVVFNINYRLAGDSSLIDAVLDRVVADAGMAVEWIRTHSAHYHIDPESISLAGDSAGGALVVQACYRNPERIRARACIDLWGGLPRTATSDQKFPWSGPIYPAPIMPGTPPTLMIHGEKDPVVPHQTSIDLAAKLTAAGIEHQLILLPGASHYPQEQSEQFIPQMIQFTDKFSRSR